MKKITSEFVSSLFPERKADSHKGDYGHALLLAGSAGKGGAALLAAKGVLRSGAGLLTVHSPEMVYGTLQISLPEAMCSIDSNQSHISVLPLIDSYSAIGAGPGIGRAPETAGVLKSLLLKAVTPMVLDADALNILSDHRELLEIIPFGTILTPHPGEFDRLTERHITREDRIKDQQIFTEKYGVIVVLKGASTTISAPGGEILVNSTGNPGMATAGCGDLLTGMILGLLARGFAPMEAAACGVYIHGLAGEIAAAEFTQEAMIAGDVADSLSIAFKLLLNLET
ncbi:MAG: NAD(P)H-hydrate dehydratase [Bacteroidales bacterium]|jgi:NAD(P)H-hydrate epimerase|nr:NAD(P)H-hydrate dehydratase [Bacteroidales bacterium]MDD4057499.1 NAD(P)H-hydrate dehydratase [Bacteroidales bacterium]